MPSAKISDGRQARRTIRDGNRTNEIIKRLRALFSKRDLAIESMDLNEATREVVALSLSEFGGPSLPTTCR